MCQFILQTVEHIHFLKEFDNLGDLDRIIPYYWAFDMESVSSESEGFTGEQEVLQIPEGVDTE